MIFSVSGHVNKPQQLSSCRSASRSRICSRSAGGMRNGRKLKAVIPGGSSVPVVPGDMMMKANMDYDSLQEGGLGARHRPRSS